MNVVVSTMDATTPRYSCIPSKWKKCEPFLLNASTEYRIEITVINSSNAYKKRRNVNILGCYFDETFSSPTSTFLVRASNLKTSN